MKFSKKRLMSAVVLSSLLLGGVISVSNEGLGASAIDIEDFLDRGHYDDDDDLDDLYDFDRDDDSDDPYDFDFGYDDYGDFDDDDDWYNHAVRRFSKVDIPVNKNQNDIGIQKAKQIVLEKFPGWMIIKSKRDYDDGILHYEFELRNGRRKVEVKVLASNGRVYDVDYDD